MSGRFFAGLASLSAIATNSSAALTALAASGTSLQARANALEDNVTIYHTINGRRTEKKRANMKVAPNQWHTLRVEFAGKRIRVVLDGKVYIETNDEHIAGPGRVGVWTKADSVTAFDDFSYGSR